MEAYQELEKKFGGWSGCNNPNTVAVASGTAALHVALEALQLPLGSEVIMPDFTMVACARAVVMAGLVPVFVDCGEDLNIDCGLLKSALSHKTSAIMAVHIYGRRCDMDSIHRFANWNGLKVIEDLAEAHGVAPDPATDAACWSFYKNKIIAGEEGGMIAFKNVEHVEYAVSLRSLGFTLQHDFNHIPRGVNARMSNAHAKLILGSFVSYSQNVERRRQIEAIYDAEIPSEYHLPKRDAVWVYDLICPRGIDPARVVNGLNTAGINARLGFKPMHTQKEFEECAASTYAKEWSRATEMSERVVYLPVDPRMPDEGVTTAARTLVAMLAPIHQ